MKTIVISVFFASFLLAGAAASPVEEATRLNDSGLKEIREGRFTDGARDFAAEVGIWRSLGDGYRQHLAIALANFGSMQAVTGNFGSSIQAYEEALSICPAAFGPQDAHTAAIGIDYARSLMAVDEDEKAGRLLAAAYDLARATSPNGSVAARSLRDLATLAIRRGEARRAEEYLAQVAGMPDSASPEGEVELAGVEAGLARLYSSAGDFGKADALLKRASTVYERNISPRDPRSMLLTAQKGMRYVDEKKYALGAQYLEDALARMKSAGVEDTPDAANVENSLALARLQLGETDQADVLLDRVLSMEKAFYAKPSRVVAATELNRALSFGKQRRYREAIESARSSVELYQATVGPAHPETANALMVYSDMLRNGGGGGRDEAKLARTRAQTILKQFGDGEPHKR